MNRYESVIIVDPKLEDEEFYNLIEDIKKVIISFSDVKESNIETQDIGKKKLAYAIRQHETGHYYIIEFSSNPENIRELERIYRIREEIIKFIIVRKDEE